QGLHVSHGRSPLSFSLVYGRKKGRRMPPFFRSQGVGLLGSGVGLSLGLGALGIASAGVGGVGGLAGVGLSAVGGDVLVDDGLDGAVIDELLQGGVDGVQQSGV